MNSNHHRSSDELLEQFREQLRKPISDRFFEEIDLINAFDIAGDDADNYIRSEALQLGARLFPDSVDLIARRAIYYLELDEQAFRDFMEDNSHVSSEMMDILRLNIIGEDNPALVDDAADRIIHKMDKAHDEEIIQFIQTMHSLGRDQWLVDNYDNFCKKTTYLPTVLYEYGYIGETSEILSKLAVKALEKLTEHEPYTADYWTLLAIGHIREDDHESALADIEYALAIEPDNIQALRVKLQLLHEAGDFEQIYKLALHLAKVAPDNSDFATLACVILPSKFDLTPIFTALSPEAFASQALLMKAIKIEYPDMVTILSHAYDNGLQDHNDWIELVDFCYRCQNTGALLEIFRVYEDKTGIPLNHDYVLMKLAFEMGHYDVVAQIYNNAEPDGTIRQRHNIISASTIFIIALLRLNDTATALEAANSMLELFENGDADSVGTPIEQEAIIEYIRDIVKRIKSKKTTDWNKIEPLGM